MMERLTLRDYTYYDCEFVDDGMAEYMNRLAYYEDMEEQGRLVKFPCAPGATVYVTDLVDGEVVPCEVLCFGDFDGSGEMTVEYKVPKEIQSSVSILCSVSEFGKTVFLTREEAEQALKGGANNA